MSKHPKGISTIGKATELTAHNAFVRINTSLWNGSFHRSRRCHCPQGVFLARGTPPIHLGREMASSMALGLPEWIKWAFSQNDQNQFQDLQIHRVFTTSVHHIKRKLQDDFPRKRTFGSFLGIDHKDHLSETDYFVLTNKHVNDSCIFSNISIFLSWLWTFSLNNWFSFSSASISL